MGNFDKNVGLTFSLPAGGNHVIETTLKKIPQSTIQTWYRPLPDDDDSDNSNLRPTEKMALNRP